MSYIDPHRLSVKTVILYTKSEGGEVRMLFDRSRDEFEEIIRTGSFLDDKCSDRNPDRIYPAYIAFSNIEDGYDFRLEEINIKNGFKKDFMPSTLKKWLEAHR